MYQREHDVLFASIRKGQPINDGKRMATSTLLGDDGPHGRVYGASRSPGSRR